MPQPADRIRNVALVGHRGSGKTALHEALLFQAGAIDRLGKVTDGTTASDTEPDERARQMSISSTLSTFTWRERKINLLDTPGEPSFVADALSALRVCEARSSSWTPSWASSRRRCACGSAPPSSTWRGSSS
jgi:elongation factor G